MLFIAPTSLKSALKTVVCAAALSLAAGYALTASAQVQSQTPAPATVTATAPAPAPLGYPGQNGMPKSFADLIDQVRPSVVNVKTISETQEATTQGDGSGFVISADGKVVTNYHVIEGGTRLTVEFGNGEEFPASLIGTDEETDLAVLQIEYDRIQFPYVTWRSGADVRIGDWVLAIGNPFGIGQSSSVGIVSALNRKRVESGAFVDYLQTDATINRGNSGGPLFDTQGRVVGVNSAIYSPTGASVGIGFVIPHQVAQNVTKQILKYGYVPRGFLGAGLRTARTDENSAEFDSGATIISLGAGSPAQRAGLQMDDIILRIEDTAIRNSQVATRVISNLPAGEPARFIIQRGDDMSATFEVFVTIGARPPKDELAARVGSPDAQTAGGGTAAPAPSGPAPRSPSTGMSGMSLVDLSASFRQSIGMGYDQAGIYIESVAPNSAAARKGLVSGMVILEAEFEQVASVPTYRAIISRLRKEGKAEVFVTVRTLNGSEVSTQLPITN